ncbi:XXYS1_4_G0035360.mRNA.1.CDS.1 [Saccharomyces cerevisiae]|nr:XXYS1_4_G0035360.mRNA.1.CDS.1 [Saccharomyces cerevisiae]
MSTKGLKEEIDDVPSVDPVVSETVNSALEQLQLDDPEENATSNAFANKVSQDSQFANGPPSQMFPHPQMMGGMGFMPYSQMMQVPHNPCPFFPPPDFNDPTAPLSSSPLNAGGPPMLFKNDSPPFQMLSSSAAVATQGGQNLNPLINDNSMKVLPIASADPLWTHSNVPGSASVAIEETTATLQESLPSKGRESNNKASSFRRQTFHALSPTDLINAANNVTLSKDFQSDMQNFSKAKKPSVGANNTTKTRTQSISFDNTPSSTSFIPPTNSVSEKLSDFKIEETSREDLINKTAPAKKESPTTYGAAYPYGGPLLQPNPIMPGHPHNISSPIYGIRSPFPNAYEMGAQFQPFSPILNPTSHSLNANSPIPLTQSPIHLAPVSNPSSNSVAFSDMKNYGGKPTTDNDKAGPNVRMDSINPNLGPSMQPFHILPPQQNTPPPPWLYGTLLDILGSKAADAIFEETKDYTVELMTDSFGNYLIQKLLEEVTTEQRIVLTKISSPHFVEISLNPHGTRALQKLIECIKTDEEAQIVVDSLRPYTVQLSKDLNGNHVIQKCLQRLKPENFQFIFDAISDSCIDIATHRHGCCVLQRCLDHGTTEQCDNLCDKLLALVDKLTLDPFGNYVVQYIITKEAEKNKYDYTHKIVHLLKPRAIELSIHKFGSNVIEKILKTAIVSEPMILEILNNGGETGIQSLLNDSYGNYVLQTALDISHKQNDYLYKRLSEIVAPLLVGPIRNTPHGKRIIGMLHLDS